jgi:septal ring factor EnvC (AmiA/AmiB activator)
MKKFVTLGTESVEYLKDTRASEGNLLSYILLVLSAFLCFFIRLSFPFLHWAAANARISSLEAELKASRKAWDAATAAKTTAEKSTKSALARAKKVEKALSDANKEHIQREQAVTERLNKIYALAGGAYHAFPFFC